jgi:hypothetical protein
MNKIYQPIVIEKTNDIIESLIDFFDDYEIESLDFAKEYLCDKLTEKFINGELEEDEIGNVLLFTESEFEVILKELIAGSILYELKDKGLIGSYEDNTTEETFFLTKKGKKALKEDNFLNELD